MTTLLSITTFSQMVNSLIPVNSITVPKICKPLLYIENLHLYCTNLI